MNFSPRLDDAETVVWTREYIFIRWCDDGVFVGFRFNLKGCHDPSGPEGRVDHGHAHAPHEGVGRPHCEAGGLVDKGDTGRAHRPKRDGDDETHQEDQQGVVPGPKKAKLYCVQIADVKL